MAQIDDKQYIIAIGASAGGLEAISAFFDHTQLDAVSYIVIQHLSADFNSQMAHILKPHSKLKVIEASDKMVIEPNTVYLIPSTNFMVIKDGKLILSDKKIKPIPYMTINYFFTSLAEERGDKAIGIILSGTGNDGSKGIEAIKRAGGMVIVQDPETTGFSGMPLAAIATGYADLVLAPEVMPHVIEEYVKDGIIEGTDHKNINISDSQLEDIIGLIKGNLPLDFTDYKRPTILRRIKRRMDLHNFGKTDSYYAYLKSDPKEIELLANDFLVSVTSFFRDADAFKIIEEKVIPVIIDHKGKSEAVKIWVAGCATGEEAYSLAILVSEYLDKTEKYLEVKIFASDISKEALEIASKGVYPDTIEKKVSKERLERYFSKEGSNFKLKHEIRKMLIFAQHDLVKNPPYCNVDLISCRNLLIYMNPALQKKVLSMMHFGLKKEGFLFLGPSESIGSLKEDFKEISSKWNILKSNKYGRSVKFDIFSSPVIEGIKAYPIEASKKTETPVIKFVESDEFNLAILEESGLTGVCTNQHFKVVKSFGDPSGYLKNKMFNFNLDDLLPDHVAITFKAAVQKALKLNQKVVLQGLDFEGTGTASGHLVDIVIKPIQINTSDEKLFLILFKDNKTKSNTGKIIKASDVEQITKEYLINLEKELEDSKQSLEAAYERIESSDENMQSFNEELLSANEEMQSANEELQSVNEELQTINKEHQVTNSELTELNDDLNNYFRSSSNGKLFVDRDLLLKKYSPAAVSHINIRDSDIGRPLSNITTNIKFETLIDDIKKVIVNNETIVREAESTDGKVYQVMTMPYIRRNIDKPDGAIISFYDITELKQLTQDLDTKNKSLLRINDDLNNFVYGASHDLNAPVHNIESLLGMLREKMDTKDPDVIELSGMIKTSITNFKAIIKDLSKVGTIESEKLEENQTENFVDVFNDIKETISEKIRLTNSTFKTNFLCKEIHFPKKNLRSIILNLVTNAIKFCPDDRYPEIMIKTEKSDNFILLTVKDNGIGINQDKIEHIFGMYQRMNEDIEGSGIGLYLIRKIVDASGGKIEVESELGKGSDFKVFFKIG
jgi:two-component system CheB/CheR fusion protein